MSDQAARHLVSTDTRQAETKRKDYGLVVCPAGRAAIDRALSVTPRLGATEMRVVLAVVYLTAMWSKLTDRVYLQQIADLAKVGAEAPGDADDAESVERWMESRRKSTSRALRRCAQLGILIYRPGKGKGNPSTIGIPALDEDLSFKRELPSPLLNDTTAQKGAVEIPKGGCSAPLPGKRSSGSSSSSATAPPEVAEEEDSDSVGRACRLVAERRLALRTGKPITNRERWLGTVANDVRSELAGQDFAGLSPEAIADRVQPMPGPLYADAGARAAPWTELADGTAAPPPSPRPDWSPQAETAPSPPAADWRPPGFRKSPTEETP